MIIKSRETNHKIVGPMKINEYFINSDFSGALIEINGDHGKIKCLNEDRVYFIINGNGKFFVDDNETEVETNDVIFIPKNMPYNIVGKMKFFMLCSPAFNPEDDVRLDY